MNKARGMPDMSLKPDTEEFLKEQQEAKDNVAKKIENQEIFTKPNVEVKIDEIKEEIAKEPLVLKDKVKKKLTEKQLEALKKGREKSIATRKAKAEAKKQAKAPKNHIEHSIPQVPQVPQIQTPHLSNNIDYDKIINGVSNIFEARQRKQQEVEVNVKEFEAKVRQEERNKVLLELEKIQKDEEHTKNTHTAHTVLNRAPQSANPYAYALNMGARNRYSRY
tara:strand:- start:178 stop:840 length:663 start_codon:yes stop_codon:yes gene_type:complete